MSAISTILTRLRAAIWAIDVRDDIANAIEQCYSDVSNPTLKTEALEAALQTKIDAGEMAALTIGDHTITTAKLASGVIDNTLATSGAAADAKKTGDEIAAVKADLDAVEEALENVDGLSNDVKTALLACFEHVGWTVDEDERNAYYTALETALYPATVTSISAVYTQKTIVYDTNSLDVLKPELIVTATMSDSTTRVVTGYTLSGTLTAGTSTVTVAYGGATTTFTVNVTQYSDAETLWINGYADGNSAQAKAQYAPFYLASLHYMMERTKRIVALEMKVLTAGTLSIGHELESECIGKLPSQARAGFVLDETITISGTGKKKIYLQTPILLGEGECFAIGATTDTAIFAYGASSPDKKFYYTGENIVFADASRGLGINVYVE